MALLWNRRTGSGTPLERGPRGRILFLGAFNGGIGGIERLTRTFAAWVENSGFTATMLFRHVLGPGPFAVESTDHVRVLEIGDWSAALAQTAWDHVYVMPAALEKRVWIPRLAKLQGTRIGLELDHESPWTDAFDVLHAEAPRDHGFGKPVIVATPDPVPTMPPGDWRGDGGGGADGLADGDFALTVFTPYGPEKGYARVPAFLGTADLDLVWCYDLSSFASRSRRWKRRILDRVEGCRHQRLRLVESPSQTEIYDLYRRAAGYVCFSEREGLGWALLDALALGKPICAEPVGVCRAIEAFEPTADFSRPVFQRYPMPATIGFEGLFTAVETLGRPRAS